MAEINSSSPNTQKSVNPPPVIYQSPWGAPNLFYGNIVTLMTQSPDVLANPNKKLFIDAITGDSITCSQYINYIGRFAYVLKRKYRVGWDDVVCLFAPNSMFTPVIHHGIISGGGIVSPANIAYTPQELRHQLEVSQSKVIIVGAAFLETAKEAASSPNAVVEQIVLIDEVINDILTTPAHQVEAPVPMPGRSSLYKDAYYCFSSGTSGVAKGVMTTHHNMTSNLLQQQLSIGKKFLNTESVYAAVLPMSHIFGLFTYAFASIYVASTTVVFPRFHLETLLEKICEHRIDTLHVVPPMVVQLAKNPVVDKYPIEKYVKRMFSGAAPLGKEIIEVIKSKIPGLSVVQGYGLTESSPGAHLGTYDPDQYDSASIGWLMAGCEARLVDEEGRDVPSGHRGELWIRGPNIMKGYLGNPEATAATLTPDGFLRTGDVAVIGKNGQYYIVDRIKELIKSKGHQVAPAELEAILLSHPGVADVAVTGYYLKHEATELPRAFLVLKDGTDPLEVKKWFDDQVARHKKLWGGVVVLDAIPKSPSGKILRRILRERENDVAIGYTETQSKL